MDLFVYESSGILTESVYTSIPSSPGYQYKPLEFSALDRDKIIQSLSFHWFQPILAILLSDGTIKIKDIVTHNDLCALDVLHIRQHHAFCISWRPSTAQTLACSVKGGVILWFFSLASSRVSCASKSVSKNSISSLFSPYGSSYLSTSPLNPPTSVFIPLPGMSKSHDVTGLDWSPDGSLLACYTSSAIYFINIATREVLRSVSVSKTLKTVFSLSNTFLTVSPKSFSIISSFPSITKSSWTIPRRDSYFTSCSWLSSSNTGLLADESNVWVIDHKDDQFYLYNEPVNVSHFFDSGLSYLGTTPNIANISIDPSGRRLAVTFKGQHHFLLFSISRRYDISFIGRVGFDESWGSPQSLVWKRGFEDGALIAVSYGIGVIKLVPLFFQTL
ncbi:hypothetical protein GEMRC1_003161 [Eukaryota sp. GEM-RC1]